MSRPRRLLSIAHSYCVALNRRLAHELARIGKDTWEVTAVAPSVFHGDLRIVHLEPCSDEPCRLEAVRAYWTSRIHLMWYGRRLRQILREPWDVVHCWEEPYILAGAQVAWGTQTSAILVYATFQNILKSYPPPFSWFERYSLHRAAGWIAFGHTVEAALTQKASYLSRPHHTIPPGVDVDKFRPDAEVRTRMRHNLGWDSSGPPVVGYLGRLVSEKGVEFLTRVLDEVSVPWRLLMVGSGPLEASLKTWGRRYGDRVRILTGITHDQVPAYLNAMDILCAPSQTTPVWREQFGRMLIEAFACGIPVIASDSGEIPFVVKDAGILVGETDKSGWVDALTSLFENPHRRSELSVCGLERARSVYAWPIVAKQHLDFFHMLTER